MEKTLAYYKDFAVLSDEELDLIKEAGAKLSAAEAKDEVHEGFMNFTKRNADRYGYTQTAIAGANTKKDMFWYNMAAQPFNNTYLESRRQLAKGFSAMGVEFDGYWAAISHYYELVIKAYKKYDLLTIDLLHAYKKLESAHMLIVSEVFRDETENKLIEQNQALREMSTPVTQLWEGILLLPLVGYLDSKRAQEVMQTMLNMIGKTQSKVFILDISGIAVVDTAVANYLIKITKATRLMGCNCLLSGISSSVAQTIVELGIQIDEMETTGNMREALNQALGKTGAEVVYLKD